MFTREDASELERLLLSDITTLQSMINPAEKEPGHAYASRTERWAAEVLQRSSVLCTVNPKARALGDIAVMEEQIPANVKLSLILDGQPNICSIHHLFDHIEQNHQAFLLILVNLPLSYHHNTKKNGKQGKKKIRGKSWHPTIKPSVTCINLLANFDLVSFHAGPQQLMMKQSMIYSNKTNKTDKDQWTLDIAVEKVLNGGYTPSFDVPPVDELMERLHTIFDNAVERMYADRKKKSRDMLRRIQHKKIELHRIAA